MPEQELQPNQVAARQARMKDCQVQGQSAKDVMNQHTQSPLKPKEQITKKAQQAARKRATSTDPLQRLKYLTKVMTRQQSNTEGLEGPSKEQAIRSGAMNTQVKFLKRLANLASLRATNSECVYLSNRQSMTIRVFLYVLNKRAETPALLDSRAMENFIHHQYAAQLKLPMK